MTTKEIRFRADPEDLHFAKLLAAAESLKVGRVVTVVDRLRRYLSVDANRMRRRIKADEKRRETNEKA